MASSLRGKAVNWVLSNYSSLDEAVNDLLDPIKQMYWLVFVNHFYNAEHEAGYFKLMVLKQYFPEITRFAERIAGRMARKASELVRQDMLARFKDLEDVSKYFHCTKSTCHLDEEVVLGDFFKEQYSRIIRDEYRGFYEWFIHVLKSLPEEIKGVIPDSQITSSAVKDLAEDLVKTYSNELDWFANSASKLDDYVTEFDDYISELFFKNYTSWLGNRYPSRRFLDLSIRQYGNIAVLATKCFDVYLSGNASSLHDTNNSCTPEEMYESYMVLEEIARNPQELMERIIRNLYVIAEIVLEVLQDSRVLKLLSILENEYYRVFGEPLLTDAREEELKRKWLDVFNKIGEIEKKLPVIKNICKCERREDIVVCTVSYTGEEWFTVAKAFRLVNNIAEPVFEIQFSSFDTTAKNFYYFEDVDVVVKALGVLEDMLKATGDNT